MLLSFWGGITVEFVFNIIKELGETGVGLAIFSFEFSERLVGFGVRVWSERAGGPPRNPIYLALGMC